LPLPAAAGQGDSGRAVRDTIAVVFRQRAYDRSVIRTLWDRILGTIFDWIGDLFRAIGHSQTAKATILFVLAAILAVVAIRVLVFTNAGLSPFGRGRARHGRAGAGGDPWADAQRLAAAGQYTDAAHALYRALLESIARREHLRLHPSKTVGDYGRDLRRGSSVLFPPYREFARSYETVVYGWGICDRARYERLYTLATGMIRPAA
jgi:hypothetical protein